MEFITLTEPGIGQILIRHTEITLIEPTAYCLSRIVLSNGVSKIVEESATGILLKIRIAEEITAKEATQG